jgi:hypothetical protein
MAGETCGLAATGDSLSPKTDHKITEPGNDRDQACQRYQPSKPGRNAKQHPENADHLKHRGRLADPAWAHFHRASQFAEHQKANSQQQITADDDTGKQQRKRWTPTGAAKRDHGCKHQAFICNWIENRAKPASLVPSASDKSIHSIGNCREAKSNCSEDVKPLCRVGVEDGQTVAPCRPYKYRNQTDSSDRDLVGQCHRQQWREESPEVVSRVYRMKKEWLITELCERPELAARITQKPEQPAHCRLTELALFVLDAYLTAERRKFLLQLLFEMLLSFFWEIRFFGRSKLR